jgi:ABC-2 type transport system permease protein
MSVSIAPTAGTGVAAGRAARPSFLGAFGGEFLKISRMRIFWVMAALYACLIVGPQIVFTTRSSIKAQLVSSPLNTLYNLMEVDLSLLRVFGGIFILVLAAHVIGLEYQHGTIRVLLGRGIGRLQLLGAKTLALVVAAAGILIAGLAIEMALDYVLILAVVGNTNPITGLSARFWTDARLYLLTVAISMGATLLLGIAVSVVGRSLSFGLGVGLSWFAADNLGTLIMLLAYQFTQADFWRNITGFFLGPILNTLPQYLIAPRTGMFQTEQGLQTISRPAATIGANPLVNISTQQALWVIAGYCAIFAIVSIVLTWRRDVLE